MADDTEQRRRLVERFMTANGAHSVAEQMQILSAGYSLGELTRLVEGQERLVAYLSGTKQEA